MRSGIGELVLVVACLALLCPPATAQPAGEWLPGADGSVPSGALVGGVENGEARYVCRGEYQGGTHPGKIVGRHCNIGWGGREINLSSYEVLLDTGDLSWESVDGIPPNAVAGGLEEGRPLYVCRGSHRGGTHPGKIVAGQCNIGWAGEEVRLASYEVLVAEVSAPCAPGVADREAGPIWSQQDAERKCPPLCRSHDATWNGEWRTTVPGQMSECACEGCCADVEAGPIRSQQDAETRCPQSCAGTGGAWSGEWRTTISGRMSVCSCCGGLCSRRSVEVEAGPIWNQADAKHKCPAICSRIEGSWDGAWRTTVPGQQSVCGCLTCG